MRDVYAWVDPFEEQQRAVVAESGKRQAERDLMTLTKGFGARLIGVWDGMASFIVREVAKPYAYEHGSECIKAIASFAEITDTRDPAHPEMLTFQVNTIHPIRIASRVYDDGRTDRPRDW